MKSQPANFAHWIARGAAAAALWSAMLFSEPALGQFADPPPVDYAARQKVYAELRQESAELQKFSGVLKKVVHVARPTVVHIEAKKNATDELSGRAVEEAGSGVIVSMKGNHYVLTNRHVVAPASPSRVKVRLDDGRTIEPTRIWSDRNTDVAVLAISAENLAAARLGDSEQLEMGDFVLAVGSPFGLSHSVSFGIVSHKNRHNLALGSEDVKYQNFIQTDAAINPGNSGGPLLNMRGEVVGINTAIASNSGRNEGIGFSIPVNMVAAVARQLVETGVVRWGYLGVNLDSRFSASKANQIGLARPRGARVSAIVASSPAASKIEIGDVILAFDGVEIEDDSHLIYVVGFTPIGKEVPVVVFREGREATVRIRVSENPS